MMDAVCYRRQGNVIYQTVGGFIEDGLAAQEGADSEAERAADTDQSGGDRRLRHATSATARQ